MQDARKELEQAIQWQKQALNRLNEAGNANLVCPTPANWARFHDAIDTCKEADALVAFWRAVCAGKVSLG